MTTDTLKALRDRTGVSIMQCKKALEEAGGDIEKAEVILRKKSGAAADKKADRTLAAGAIGMYVHDGVIGAMVLLSCETDFVARNDAFSELAKSIAMQVAATNPRYRSIDDVPEAARSAAREVFMREVEGKPAELQASILEGNLQNYFKDQALLAQPFIKDESKTVHELLTEATQKFGERIEVSEFARFSAR